MNKDKQHIQIKFWPGQCTKTGPTTTCQQAKYHAKVQPADLQILEDLSSSSSSSVVVGSIACRPIFINCSSETESHHIQAIANCRTEFVKMSLELCCNHLLGQRVPEIRHSISQCIGPELSSAVSFLKFQTVPSGCHP